MVRTLDGSPATGRMALAARLAPLLLPAILWVVLLPSMGRMPGNDYYGIFTQVVDGDRFTAQPLRWLHVKSNEHTVVLPALIYAGNVSLTGGDNRWLSGFALLLLGAIAALLVRLLPAELRVGRDGACWAFLLSALVFTPAAAHSIVLGFSGTIWFLSNLFALVAVVRLAAHAAQPSRFGLWGVLAAGLLGALTYSTNLSLWPALLLGACLLRLPARRLVALAAGGALALSFATWTYTRPAHHPAPELADPVAVGSFAAVYLGAPLAEDPRVAGVLGLGGLLLFGCLATRVLSRRGKAGTAALVPWLVLQLYAVGNAFGTAVARAGIGGARSSRYASVAILFWASLTVAGAVLAVQAGLSRRWRAAALAGGLLLAAATWTRGTPVLLDLLERAARHPLAELALVYQIPDHDALKAVSPAPLEVESARQALAAFRHVPFDRPPVVTYGQVVAVQATGRAPAPLDPATVTLTPVGGPVLRVELPATPALAESSEALLVGRGNVARGVLRDVSPPWFVRALRGGKSGSRWAGYVVPATDAEPLLVCSTGTPEMPVVPLATLTLASPLAR